MLSPSPVLSLCLPTTGRRVGRGPGPAAELHQRQRRRADGGADRLVRRPGGRPARQGLDRQVIIIHLELAVARSTRTAESFQCDQFFRASFRKEIP